MCIMTPHALRHLRESRDWTREEMAQQLGGITASSVVKWERGERPIPPWVVEKLLRTVEITFSVADLQRLVDYALQRGADFETILASAVRQFLQHQPATPTNVHTLPTLPQGMSDANLAVAELATPYQTASKPHTACH